MTKEPTLERLNNGLFRIDSNDQNLLDKIKQWNDQTTLPNGVLIPEDYNLFKTKVILAASLFPQITGHTNNYLFGKGVGVEIAIQGIIKNRTVLDNSTPKVRSHSDFELYGHTTDSVSGLEYPTGFKTIFGAQEIYPNTQTKALKNLPENLLWSTKETVEFEGAELFIPQLEILFLDKFLRRESTPRDAGYDYELLANKYQLDWELIHEYLDKYYINIEEQRINKAHPKSIENSLGKIINQAQSTLTEDNKFSIQNLITLVNSYFIGSNINISGIHSSYWINLTEEDIDQTKATLTLNEGFIKRIKDRLDEDILSQIKKLHTIHDELRELENRISQS